MSTKYEDMSEAARAAQKRSNEYRERCWGYLNRLLTGFGAYAQVPAESVRYLRWNGLTGLESRYEDAEEGHRYTPPGATVLGDDGFWTLGIRIFLSSGAFVTFALFAAEHDGKPVAKIGVGGKLYTLYLSDPNSFNGLYDDIVEKTKLAFDGNRKPNQKSIGFVAELADGQ